jgi:hypothetical protein
MSQQFHTNLGFIGGSELQAEEIMGIERVLDEHDDDHT